MVHPFKRESDRRIRAAALLVDDVRVTSHVINPTILAMTREIDRPIDLWMSRHPDVAGELAVVVTDFFVSPDPVACAAVRIGAYDLVANLQLGRRDFEDFVAVG